LNAVLAKAIATRGTYSVVKQLQCTRPYGQYISMDGVHPNVQGYQEMANAAAEALNTNYGFTIPTNPQTALTYVQVCGP